MVIKIKLNEFICFTILSIFLTNCDNGNNDAEFGNSDTDSTAIDSETDRTIELNGDNVFSTTLLKERTASEAATIFSLMQLQVPPAASFASLAQYDVTVYKLVYHTTYLQQNIRASALLAIPDTATPVPTISFQNGTNTQYAMAPTEDYDSLFMNVLTSIASLGYVMLVADYIGFGESTQIFHPYLCKETTTISLVDMLLATAELEAIDEAKVQLTEDLFIVGYSQGGHATMALHEYLTQQTEFPYTLRATAAGAGPYNLDEINEYIFSVEQYEQPYYAPYTILAYQSIGFISDDLSLYFSDVYTDLIPGLFDGQKSSDEINASLTTDMLQLYSDDLVDGLYTAPAYGTLATAFAENSVHPVLSSTPIRLYHGTSDTYIPLDSTISLYNEIISAGTEETLVEYIELEGENHESAAPHAIVDAVSWFNQLSGY